MKQKAPIKPAQRLDHEASFLAVKAEIDAITDEQLIPINVDLERTVSVAVGASVRLQSLKPGFAKLFFTDADQPDRLRLYAYAALHAHMLANESAPKDDRFPMLIEEGSKLREALLATAELLAQFGEVSAERVAEIRSGTGHLDTASDLVALSRLFEDNWQRLQGKSPVTRQQFVRAGIVGTDLIELLGTRRFVPAPIAADDPARIRARAFTLLVRKYDECRRATVALRWHEDDADAFMPTLYAKRRRRAADPIEDETPETDLPPTIEPVVAPITPGASTPIAADVPVTA